IVDYIGIAQNLKSALQQYSKNDREQTGVDESQAIAVMLERYEVVRDMYHGFADSNAVQHTRPNRFDAVRRKIAANRHAEWTVRPNERPVR
ncbi:type I restriction enzyme endonuclease domain-containing protein, partial [Burkholderia sp. SIMBA_051]|uniref:type I restriction enzyme endonuclease domain-containing protein n=1 Tax=Burkholderia sp. SIMBA_051 TaxID=3085792 RepID=UPI00397CBB99